MNRILHHAAFAVGLLAVAWVGAGYIPGSPLALALVLLIGAFFLMGALELRRFQQATAGLAQVLADTHAPPPALAPWLARLHPSLQHAVRLRVEGERAALPGPALTPYLAGLLVLLGMLGTFLGMIVTLKGTGLALENAADVEAIRASLAAPVKGLGLAFGTSVAGVAASAMLGLMSALARRERQRTVQQLDGLAATTLRGFSRAHQREESLRLLAAQAEVMPALVTQLQTLVTQFDRQGQALQDRLLAGQVQFHGEAQRAYSGLAESVDRSLKTSLADSARLAGAAIEPAVQATLAGLARETVALRETVGAAVQRQLDGMAAHMDRSVADVVRGVGDAMAERQQQVCTALERSALAITAQTDVHARATLDEIARLVQTASQAPQAAAEVIGELRRALSDSLVRDNAVLDERNRLLATLGGLLDAVNHGGTEQRAAIDALVQASTEMLERAGTRFADGVEAGTRTLHGVAAQVTSSAAEVASLGEGFGVAVQLFSSASEQLTAQLQRIESALGLSMARSDEQLAYYVAQAREIIDLTLGSQKQIVDDLQSLARSPATPAEAHAA